MGIEWTSAAWRKGKRTVTGSWRYDWAADCFYIYLDKKCPYTGDPVRTTVYGVHPEFNGWKLVKDKKKGR